MLAIMQAGAYIAKGHCSIEQFPNKFRQQRAKLLLFSPKQVKSRYSHVFATFEASAYVLEESLNLEAKDALCLLEVLAILHFSDLSMKIFEFAWRESQERRMTKITQLTLCLIGIFLSFQASYLRNSMSGTNIGSRRPAMFLRPFF